MAGTVVDDGGQGPDGGRASALANVRVEVLDGPRAGTVAFTDASGVYRLRAADLGSGPVSLRATRDGYDSNTKPAYPELFAAPSFTLGRPPHTVWGDVILAFSTPGVPVPNVRVEILDGPNAGKVAMGDDLGRYRFDDLVASDRFAVLLSRAGYRNRTYAVADIRYSARHDFQIEPQ